MIERQVVPRFYVADASDIDTVCQMTSVHESLIDFWRTKGSADYNRNAAGAKMNR